MELSKQIKNIEQRQIYRFIDSTCTTCNVMEVVWNGVVYLSTTPQLLHRSWGVSSVKEPQFSSSEN